MKNWHLRAEAGGRLGLAGRSMGAVPVWEPDKAGKGLVQREAMKVGAWSRAQFTRLNRRCEAEGKLRVSNYRRRRFAPRHTVADVGLLAGVDKAHETLSGPATRSIWEREFAKFQRPQCARLAGISKGSGGSRARTAIRATYGWILCTWAMGRPARGSIT